MNDENDKQTLSSPIVDGKKDRHESCIVYKFYSRPPYEGFILILIIIVIAILLIWWLHSPRTKE